MHRPLACPDGFSENLRRLTIDRSGDGWNEEDWLKDPGDVERSCTDVSWVGFCGTCLLVLAAIGFAGMTERAVDLLATRDSSGHTCGEGSIEECFSWWRKHKPLW
ncbi:unnamed protein product [Effrenium voratum]|nr:unnamed protein product [Effrenium voratum]